MNRRFLGSLLLALILPLAQVAAAAHDVSHVQATVPALHCDLCDVAANITGGGAASHSPVVLHAPAQPLKPTWHAPAPRAAEPVAFFRSRAPPSLL